MPHPNQLALAVTVDRWIDEAGALPDHIAAERLDAKVRALQAKIHIFSLAAFHDRGVDDESLQGLSAVDLMAAQDRVIVERNVRARFAAMEMAA